MSFQVVTAKIPETDVQVSSPNFGLEKTASSCRPFTLIKTMAMLKLSVGNFHSTEILKSYINNNMHIYVPNFK